MNYYDMNEYYDYGSPYMETTLIGIMMIFFIIMLVCLIFALLSYILRGVGMYTMAKRQGMEYAWLAFIPFARTYLHGELAGSIRLKSKSIQNPGIWLLALPFLYGAVSSLLNAVMWFVGVGSLTRILQNTFLPYGRVNLSGGAVMGIVVLMLIFFAVSLGYTAVYKSFEVLVNHQIMERFTTKNMSIVHAVLSTLIPLYESICFFVMRNRPFNPGMEPPTPPPFMQSPPPDSYYRGPVPPPEPPVPPMGDGFGASAGNAPMGDGFGTSAGNAPMGDGFGASAGNAPMGAGFGASAGSAPMGGSYGDSSGTTPMQETPGAQTETSDFGNTGNAFTPSGFGNTGSIYETTAHADSQNTESIFGTSDSENTGSILGTPDSENTGGILGTSDSENAGSIFGPSVSANTGNAENISSPQAENTPEPTGTKTESTVNFTLPENENKDL